MAFLEPLLAAGAEAGGAEAAGAAMGAGGGAEALDAGAEGTEAAEASTGQSKNLNMKQFSEHMASGSSAPDMPRRDFNDPGYIS